MSTSNTVEDVFRKITPTDIYDHTTRKKAIADVKKYIDTLGDLNKLTPHLGESLLHRFLHIHIDPPVEEIINYLIYNKGLDVNAKDNNGLTVFLRSTGFFKSDDQSLHLLYILANHPKVDLNSKFPDGTTVHDMQVANMYPIVKKAAEKRGITLEHGFPPALTNLVSEFNAKIHGREEARKGKQMDQEIIKHYKTTFPKYDPIIEAYMESYTAEMMNAKGGKTKRRGVKRGKSKKQLKKSKKVRRH